MKDNTEKYFKLIKGGVVNSEIEPKQDMYLRAMLRSYENNKKLPADDRDELKKFVFLYIKYIVSERRSKESRTFDQELALNRFTVMSTIMDLIGELTPLELMQMFPVDKTYDGHKFEMKDYFYTMDKIRKLDVNKPIGKEKVFSLLWDYHNINISFLLVEHMTAMSDLNRFNTGKGIMEEFLEENGVDTYTFHEEEGYMVNNQTGQCSKIYKPKKRIPKQFSIIK